MLGNYQTNIDCKYYANVILKKEKYILKKHSATTIRGEENFDGQTGLGVNSLTSRYCNNPSQTVGTPNIESTDSCFTNSYKDSPSRA